MWGFILWMDLPALSNKRGLFPTSVRSQVTSDQLALLQSVRHQVQVTLLSGLLTPSPTVGQLEAPLPRRWEALSEARPAHPRRALSVWAELANHASSQQQPEASHIPAHHGQLRAAAADTPSTPTFFHAREPHGPASASRPFLAPRALPFLFSLSFFL